MIRRAAVTDLPAPPSVFPIGKFVRAEEVSHVPIEALAALVGEA
jgi:hypothetical protein